MVKELKEFLLRGNVVDLAVAVVIGAAFGLIIAAFVDGIVNPLVALIFGQPDMSTIGFTVNESFFAIGSVLQATLNFILVGTVLFFFIKAANRAMEKNEAEEEVAVEETPEDIVLLRQIRDQLRQNA